MRGVYAAIFDRPYGDELMYVGSALVLERRWAVHERKLRKGVHENTRFQRAYDKYGKFRWEVLEQLPGADEDTLVAAEQRWYDKLLAECGKANLLNLMRPERYPMADPEVRERHRAVVESEEWRAKNAAAAVAALAKRYIVTTPDGDELEVYNLNAFCREEGLNQGHMVSVARGLYTHHKGWRCRYADEEDDYDEEA